MKVVILFKIRKMINLEKEEIKNGFVKCLNNSKSLLDDADFLFEGNRIPRAYAIYVLCTEEVQKAYLLFKILMDKENNKVFTKEDINYSKNFFSSHTLKIKAAASLSFNYNYFAEKHNLKKVKTLKQNKNDFFNPKQKDISKQQGFYVDLVHRKFKEPLKMITFEKCIDIQSEAKLSVAQLITLKRMYFTCPDVFIDKFKD